MNTETKKGNIIEILTAFVVAECETVDVESRYDEMLNECYDFEKVGGPFQYMQPSRVLYEVDPIAYNCGFSDFTNGDFVEIDGDYYEKSEVDDKVEEFISSLESSRDELEEELIEMEGGDEPDAEAIREKQVEIAQYEADLDACRRHSF